MKTLRRLQHSSLGQLRDSSRILPGTNLRIPESVGIILLFTCGFAHAGARRCAPCGRGEQGGFPADSGFRR